MATIWKRKKKNGDDSWRCQVRRRGFKELSQDFLTKEEAEKWGEEQEIEIEKMVEKKSKNLTIDQRLLIKKLLDEGCNQSNIAKILGIAKSVVSYELRRFPSILAYDPNIAHQDFLRRYHGKVNDSNPLKPNKEEDTQWKQKIESQLEALNMQIEILTEQIESLLNQE